METISLFNSYYLRFRNPKVVAHGQIKASQSPVGNDNPEINPTLWYRPQVQSQKKSQERDEKPEHSVLLIAASS
jgi:hypothetical protein